MSDASTSDQEDDAADDLALDERPTSLDQVDRASVSRVIRHVGLTQVRVQHSHAEIRTLSVPDDWHEAAYLLWRASMVHRHDSLFVTEVGFLLRYYDGVSALSEPELPTGDDAPDQAVDVTVDFELFYELDAGDGVAELTNVDLQHFSFLNGPQNAWGYMREFMHSTTGRMGIPAFVAPVLRIPNLPASPTAEADA